MSSLTLLVLLDAFRPDYLWRTRFLRDLARQSAVGAIEEPFGFVPRAAYFGGLTPNQSGDSHLFVRDGWRSPFPLVPSLARLEALADTGRIRERAVADAQRRVPDFAARYADGFALSTRDLDGLAIAERQPPWGPRCGYRSLFHVLDDAGLPWLQCSWPYTREVTAADVGIVGRCLDQLRDDTRFAFVHLSALDAVGHTDGPGSAALQHALDETDRSCQVLWQHARERYDRVRLILFGDHGMVQVVRHVDLRATLDGVDLAGGRDYQVFIDSPMARFWFASPAAREAMTRHLASSADGRVLDRATLARFDADRLPPANGELFFVAHPGVVFAPNAFQAVGPPVRGMHGYLPDVPDNRGLLLLHDSAMRVTGQLGVVNATRLFPTCLQWCDLDPSAHTSLAPARADGVRAGWTTKGDVADEARADADVRVAVRALSEAAPGSAVVVTGSFGRSEGAMRRMGDRRTAMNDYDFAVIGPDAAAASPLGPALATRLGTDFCDVMAYDTVAAVTSSQLHFDLRYGSRVVAGDRRVLDRLPAWAPADIPARAAALLLMNRMAGVMLVPLPEQCGDAPLSAFARNQLAKAWVAVGDAGLLAAGDYSSRAVERRGRVRALAAALGLAEDVAGRVDAAFAYKLDPHACQAEQAAEDFAALRGAVATALCRMTGQTTADRRPTTVAPVCRGWSLAVDAAMFDVAADDDAAVVRRLRHVGFAPPDAGDDGRADLRRVILTSVVALFRCGPAVTDDDLESVRPALARLGAPALAATTAHGRAEDVRHHVATAWLAACH